MILDAIINLFSVDVGVDLGTANTLVFVKGKGVVINEPSVIALRDGEVVAVGRDAMEMFGRTHQGLKVERPLKDGVIADFDVTEMMLREFLKKALSGFYLTRPRVVVGVPSGITQVEEKAVEDAFRKAGAKDVMLVPEPMAAAIGAGLPVSDPVGSMIVDIGGGTTEIGVISLGGLVISKSIRVAGDKLDAAIVDYLKKQFNLLIGDRVAEDLKIRIGTAVKLEEELITTVRGRDQVEGTLTSIEITSEHIREAMTDPLRQIAEALKSVLEQTPPDLAGDIVENGVVLTGGGALIRGLDKYLSDIVKLPVYIAEDPLLAVAKGTGKALDELDLLQQTSFEE